MQAPYIATAEDPTLAPDELVEMMDADLGGLDTLADASTIVQGIIPLPEEDLAFVSRNEHGCWYHKLIAHIDPKKRSFFECALREGRIHTIRKVVSRGKRGIPMMHFLPRDEMLRILDLYRNYQAVTEAARSIGARLDVFKSLAQSGTFGSCIPGLTKDMYILLRPLDKLKAEYNFAASGVGTGLTGEQRICQFPDCSNILPSILPAKVAYCNDHQLKKSEFMAELQAHNFLPLPQHWITFAFHHTDGCKSADLAGLMAIPAPRLARASKSKPARLKASWRKVPDTLGRVRDCLWVDFDEMIRVMDLQYNWILVLEAARIVNQAEKGDKIQRDTILFYVTSNLICDHQKNLSDEECIPRAVLPFLKRLYREVREERMQMGRTNLSLLKRGEITPRMAAEQLGDQKMYWIYLWMDKGWIPFKQRGRYCFIKSSDLVIFAKSVVEGKYITNSKCWLACRQMVGSSK